MTWTDQGLDNSMQATYHFYYLDSLATAQFNNIEPGRTLAAVFASAMDFTGLQKWFGGITLADKDLPITVNVGKFSKGASWSLNARQLVIR